jgi:hypothetical protein
VCVAPCAAAADCGPGYDCVAPAVDVAPLWTLQHGTSTTYVPCDPAGSNVCATDYACQAVKFSGGTYNYCAKPATVCTPI